MDPSQDWIRLVYDDLDVRDLCSLLRVNRTFNKKIDLTLYETKMILWSDLAHAVCLLKKGIRHTYDIYHSTNDIVYHILNHVKDDEQAKSCIVDVSRHKDGNISTATSYLNIAPVKLTKILPLLEGRSEDVTKSVCGYIRTCLTQPNSLLGLTLSCIVHNPSSVAWFMFSYLYKDLTTDSIVVRNSISKPLFNHLFAMGISTSNGCLNKELTFDIYDSILSYIPITYISNFSKIITQAHKIEVKTKIISVTSSCENIEDELYIKMLFLLDDHDIIPLLYLAIRSKNQFVTDLIHKTFTFDEHVLDMIEEYESYINPPSTFSFRYRTLPKHKLLYRKRHRSSVTHYHVIISASK